MEQLKCLDQQCELRVQLLQDLQDFFRKKAEIEVDYSRNLEKLAERFLTKTRSTKDHLLKYDQSLFFFLLPSSLFFLLTALLPSRRFSWSGSISRPEPVFKDIMRPRTFV